MDISHRVRAEQRIAAELIEKGWDSRAAKINASASIFGVNWDSWERYAKGATKRPTIKRRKGSYTPGDPSYIPNYLPH